MSYEYQHSIQPEIQGGTMSINESSSLILQSKLNKFEGERYVDE